MLDYSNPEPIGICSMTPKKFLLDTIQDIELKSQEGGVNVMIAGEAKTPSLMFNPPKAQLNVYTDIVTPSTMFSPNHSSNKPSFDMKSPASNFSSNRASPFGKVSRFKFNDVNVSSKKEENNESRTSLKKEYVQPTVYEMIDETKNRIAVEIHKRNLLDKEDVINT